MAVKSFNVTFTKVLDNKALIAEIRVGGTQ